MNSKEELIKFIEEMPEEQIQQMSTLLKKIAQKMPQIERKIVPEELDPLDTFMTTVVHSLTNTMYDLSQDAKRREDKVMEKRLEVYRKKVSAGWEKYKKTKMQNDNSNES